MENTPYDLSHQSVLVTGGAGFVGSTLVRLLLDEGCRVVVYDNFLHGVKSNLEEVRDLIDIIPGDVLEEHVLAETIHSHDVQYVFHCVGDAFVPTTYHFPKRAFNINVEGTLNVLMLAKLFNVKRVLYVSSTEVYGDALKPTIDENHPLLPLNTYAVSKLAADRLCFTLFHEHGVPVIIARIFNTYGPRDTQPRVIPDIISQLSKSNIVELGNIHAERDFNYVDDTARGLIGLIKSSVPNGDAVNIGTGRSWSIEQVAKKIGKIMGHDKIEIKISHRRLRRLDVQRFCCDPTKMLKYTGWKPRVSLEEGLKRTVDWFIANGKVWSWYDYSNGAKTYR